MNAPRAGTLLAALFAALSLLAAGCQSMTTLKALEAEKGRTSGLEVQNAELQSEKATLLKRADEARKREERLAARQQAEEYVSGDPQKALAAIESIYHPPPIQKKDEQDRIQEVVVVEPPVLDKPEQAQLELLRGTALYNLKKNAEALEAFQAAVKADPSLRLARRNLGKLLFIDKRYPEALEAWKDELADGYRDADLLYLVAQARYEIGVSRDDPSEKEAARLAMQSVLIERPRDVEVQRWLANLEYESGRFAEAARNLEAIRREAPLDAEYLELLGKCYYNLRDNARALDFLQLAAQVRAPAPEEMKMLAELYAAEG